MTILPVGRADKSIVDYVAENLEDAFGDLFSVRFKSVLAVPMNAYNYGREQYDSSVILSSISEYAIANQLDRVLGITDYDLYVSGLNFVFGLAQSPGKVAIISLCRLRTQFYRQPSNNGLFEERALKEAIHEVGHTFGLGHCTNSSCVMHFSNSVLETDLKFSNLCEKCSTTLKSKV